MLPSPDKQICILKSTLSSKCSNKNTFFLTHLHMNIHICCSLIQLAATCSSNPSLSVRCTVRAGAVCKHCGSAAPSTVRSPLIRSKITLSPPASVQALQMTQLQSVTQVDLFSTSSLNKHKSLQTINTKYTEWQFVPGPEIARVG